ncbi:GH25 family lysozyme [Streptomyces sp. L7]|uniref:GH25 family lysozyme n=1 Tax=Streptomyces sp. L7 TaxID=3423954 RepID=UPI003D96D358
MAALVMPAGAPAGAATLRGAAAPTAAPVQTATPTPTPTPAPTATGSAATPSADPDLSTMNRAHNHTMGSTIRQYDPAAATAAPNTSTSPKTASPNATVTPNTVPPGLPGLDVSGWQTGINWSQVAANGAKFVYIKASESTDYTSSQFATQYNGSYAAGLTRGAYHFAVPNVSSGATQARYFVANGGGWSADGRTLPPLLDIEYDPYTSTDGTNTCYGLSQPAMVSWIADFSRTVQALTGALPAIYSTTNWWVTCTGNTAAFSANPLFIARYPNSVSDGAGTLPAGWTAYTMWQWADSGIFPGDQDVFNGNAAALYKLATTGVPVSSIVPMAQPIIGFGDLNGDGKPDVLARKPDGTLWFYAGTGASGSGAFAAGVQIGSGWGVFDSIIAAGDVNGDGKPDLLARKPDGTLWLYPGTGAVGTLSASNPGLGTGIQIGAGWDAFTDIIAAGDVNGDHKPDLLGRKPDGTLWLYAGTGHVDGTSNGYQSGVLYNGGWNAFTQVVGIGDLNGDGWDDLLAAKSDGSLWYYRGSATGYQAGSQITTPGYSPGDLLVAPGDINGDGKPDLLARAANGMLNFYSGSSLAQAAYGAAQVVGSGWNIFNRVIGAGDVNSDGKPDILATTPDGTLYFYAGNGSTNGVNRSYQNGVKIGWGWDIFSKVINGGDFTGDGKSDLVAVRNDGTLWLYPSTGVVNPTTPSSYLPGILIGSGGWSAFSQIVSGDFNGDGVQDILATRPDGTMLLYPGVRQTPSSTSWFGTPTVVGSGWNQFTAIDSTGDSNADGKADVVAQKPDGTLWFYAGNGAMGPGNAGLGNPSPVGSGWTIFSSVTGTGDTATARTGDLLGVRTDGTLVYYPGTGLAGIPTPGYAPAVASGGGWNIFG